MTKKTIVMNPIPEAPQKNDEGSADGVARKAQAAEPAKPTAPADVPQHFRRLKPGEVVGRGDFVANDQRGLEPWEGPGGFRAGAFVKPIYRRAASRSAATKKTK